MPPSKRIRLKVASPCNVPWDSMKGSESVRFCSKCQKNVYTLSNMSTEEVENLLLQPHASKPCVRFFQRSDGTLLTDDCSVGLRRKRRKQMVLGVGLGAASALGLGVHTTSAPTLGEIDPSPAFEQAPAEPDQQTREPEAEDPEVLEPRMGAVAEAIYENVYELQGDVEVIEELGELD